MGWDFGMEIDAGNDDPVWIGFEASYTFNVAPMFYAAFDGETESGIRDLHHMSGAAAAQKLRVAIERMEDDPAKYEAMNPPNGWGNYDGALELLRTLLEWCVRAPKARLTVC